MSRFSKTMVALLAMMAVTAPAFALTGDISGFLHVRGVAADNMDGRDGTDDNSRAVDERLRLYTTAALNENVKAVFTVEVDYAWGDAGVGRLGADSTGNIEIANLYLDFNVPEANTNFKVGTHYFGLGGKLILGEHASGVSMRKAFNDKMNLGLYWVKTVEAIDSDGAGPDGIGGEDDDEDVDYYQAQLDMKAGGMTISPFVGYYDFDDAGMTSEQYFYGLELKGKADALAYSAVAFYNDGRVNGANNDAFAFLANAGYTMGDTKLIAEVARYGDSDTANGEMRSVRGYNNFSEILTGGYFDIRVGTGVGGVDTSVTRANLNSTSANNSYYMNHQYVKLGVEQKVHAKGNLRAYYIYAQQAADNGTANSRLTMGHEIDAYYDYTVVPGLVMTVGGGYLLADDDYGIGVDANGKTLGGDDAWKAGLGLAYKF